MKSRKGGRRRIKITKCVSSITSGLVPVLIPQVSVEWRSKKEEGMT
jgi:hypothetical protein